MNLEYLISESDVVSIIEIIKSEKVGRPFNGNLLQKGFQRYAQKNSFKFIRTSFNIITVGKHLIVLF